MVSQPAALETTAGSRRSTVAASAGSGVFAAVIGYLVTYALISGEIRENTPDIVAENLPEWKGVAWYFYNAHMIDIETTGSIGSWGRTDTVNFIAESSSSNADLLYVVPPLVLLAVGVFLAVRWNGSDFGEAVVVGAPVAIGYAVVLGIGAVVSEYSAEGTAFGIEASSSFAPALVPAVLLGGIIYPLVFATVGAALPVAVRKR
ncbi:hypothetical protein [Natrinema halophilum]|uniref:DUF7978 domain-containing protein n=1 Tax=Natrinema halophilum TaxID=1699371 RepID=A0A7D5GTU7_9EURY|nr:hypothetical protein [Natrinema halophilum]QLG49586.1 hypothetical protein HYG82_12315 [Natrinema halophilum]